MKVLEESKKNIPNFLASAKSQIHGKEQRPGLELLNILNSKLIEENNAHIYRKQIIDLKEQNRELKTKNGQLIKQLDIQKRLRRVWNREDVILYDDIEGLKREVNLMKDKYNHYK